MDILCTPPYTFQKSSVNKSPKYTGPIVHESASPEVSSKEIPGNQILISILCPATRRVVVSGGWSNVFRWQQNTKQLCSQTLRALDCVSSALVFGNITTVCTSELLYPLFVATPIAQQTKFWCNLILAMRRWRCQWDGVVGPDGMQRSTYQLNHPTWVQ